MNAHGKATAAAPATVLAFDFGTRKIGVAIGNTLLRVAHPLQTIAAATDEERFAAIDGLLREWKPNLLLVGRPVHADATEHAMTRAAARFASRLKERYGLPVVLADERFTTQIAEIDLTQAGVRGATKRAMRDAVAAQLTLQAWFDERQYEPIERKRTE